MTKELRIVFERGPTTLVVEPLGERFAVPGAATVTLTSDHDFGPDLEVNVSPDRFSVWLMKGPDYDETLVVKIDGIVQKR